jgi:hypothetical protein
MDVCLRLFCVRVGSGRATGWSPVQGVLPTVFKKLKGNKAFHGWPMLRSWCNKKEWERERVAATWKLWLPYSNYTVVSYQVYRDNLNSDMILDTFNSVLQNVVTAMRPCSTLFCHSIRLLHCIFFGRFCCSTIFIVLCVPSILLFFRIQWIPLIVLTSGHSLIDNNNRRNKNAAVQRCLLMGEWKCAHKKVKWQKRNFKFK